MTRVSKISFVTVFALLAAGGWSQVRSSRRHEAEIASLNRQTAGQRQQIQRLRAERDELQARAAEPLPVSDPFFATGDAAFDARMETGATRINELRKWLERNPAQKIPEMQFLQDADWFREVAQSPPPFDARIAASGLRQHAIMNFEPLIRGALKSYEESHQGQLPTDVSQLAPFFVSPIDEAILSRYEMRLTGPAAAVPVDLDLPIIA